MRRVKIYRNEQREAVRVGHQPVTPNGRWFCRRHLPVRQTLIWVGRWLVVIQPRRLP